jgi:adenosylhomocysteine nucleosidase
MSSERSWITSGGSGCVVEQSGMGPRRAERAARRLVERGATALASWGTAGGLDPALGPGTVVVPDRIVVSETDIYDCDPEWRDRLIRGIEAEIRPVTGPMLQVSEVIKTTGHKTELHDRFGTVAVDMESGAVARVAAEAGVPMIAVRVVLDGAGTGLPDVDLIAPDGTLAGSRAVVAWRIVRAPGEWGAVLRLARCFRISGRVMRTVWHLTTPDLTLTKVPSTTS